MSLLAKLPRPKSKWDDDEPVPVKEKPKQTVPPYGKRQGFIPTQLSHYGDGGAFPEIHIVQYPLNMGKAMGKDQKDTLALETDRDGSIRYDLVLRQGKTDQQTVHFKKSAVTEKDVEDILRPDEDQIRETTEKTQKALEKILDRRIASTKVLDPSTMGRKEASYVRYKPQETSASESQTRIVKMMEAPKDPLEPARFKHKKIPKGPGSPPAPVLQSPPRKVTAEEQKQWIIPPAISNWKNPKGYTIPLDKRLANDGRGLQDVTINDNFAKLSDALSLADMHAREEVKRRAEMQQKLAAKEKREKEERLRQLAQRAREERLQESSDEDLTREELEELKERDNLRKTRAKEREREIKNPKDRERDISEKVALGVVQPTLSKESMYDQRLFNQSSGLSSGFMGDDAYNIYDKPLFTGSQANAIYRPKRDLDEMKGIDIAKFQGASERDGPVQFEKEDVFGLEGFMNAAKKGRTNDQQ
ncbi:SKIP/SNW domain-containing protein [Gorgonomyces haynaldii]|nr:SKIP/SNW domain-containing protein [Gorgonomyces haynaldii]